MTIPLKEQLKRKALELGFVKSGVTDAQPFTDYYDPSHLDYYYDFLQRDARHIIENAQQLNIRFPHAKSILSVIYSYGNIHYPDKLTRHIGRAYQGRCYGPTADSINGSRITLLKDYIRAQGIHIFEDCFLPDRAVAARAGCITFGKNNFAYCGEYGSFIIITNLVLDTALEPDEPTFRCDCPDDCHLCQDTCPTHAIESAHRLCPQKCIGFNNWFRQSEKNVDPFIPLEIRPQLGLHLHGCDICQEICPRNRQALSASQVKDPFLEQLSKQFDLEKILFLDDTYYENILKPIVHNYIKDYRYFRRNAAIVMGNSKDTRYLPALRRAAEDGDSLVADAVTWALSQLKN